MTPSSSSTSPGDIKTILDTLAANNPSSYQTTILRHWMNGNSPIGLSRLQSAILRDAIIVALDVEWYEHSPAHITEIGISILDPRFIATNAPPANPTRGCGGRLLGSGGNPRGRDGSRGGRGGSTSISAAMTVPPCKVADIMQASVSHHTRLAENAHLVNGELVAGHAEQYQFGPTSFVTPSEAQTMLRRSFTRYNESTKLRPVIFLGHAVDNDVAKLNKTFGLDVEALGVVVATLDTQVLANETDVVSDTSQISLGNLLAKYGVSEKYLHNGGNDVVCTLLSAFMLLCLPKPDPTGNFAASYASIKSYLQDHSGSMYGKTVYCIRCDSTTHLEAACPEKLHYIICANHSDPARQATAITHKAKRCKEDVKEKNKLLPIPCSRCVMSTDPERHARQFSCRHKDADCPFALN